MILTDACIALMLVVTVVVVVVVVFELLLSASNVRLPHPELWFDYLRECLCFSLCVTVHLPSKYSISSLLALNFLRLPVLQL